MNFGCCLDCAVVELAAQAEWTRLLAAGPPEMVLVVGQAGLGMVMVMVRCYLGSYVDWFPLRPMTIAKRQQLHSPHHVSSEVVLPHGR